MLQFPTPPTGATVKRLRYRCPTCAEKHEGFPAMGCDLPDAIYELDEDAQTARAVISTDLCILDNQRYFIRCNLHVSVHEYEEGFEFGPWVEVPQTVFSGYSVNCAYGAAPGWTTASGTLANAFPGYVVSTLGIACKVHMPDEEDTRPWVEITDASAQLFDEQNEGMTIPRAFELVSHMKGFLLLMD